MMALEFKDMKMVVSLNAMRCVRLTRKEIGDLPIHD